LRAVSRDSYIQARAERQSGARVSKHRDGEGASTIGFLARAVLDAPTPSSAAIRQAKLLLLDTIGCGLLGAREAVARAVFDVCRTGEGPCAVIGRAAKAAPLDAVLANGAAVRVLDLNDYLVTIVDGEPETGGHPSDNIPVALALGSARSRSGADILASIVTGYELYARLQAAMDRSGPWDGVTATGLVAPAIAGRLMGLDETRLAHALAMGLSRSLTPAIVRRGTLSAAKTISNALIAQSGVQAALLAEKDVTGPRRILDDEIHGVRRIFSRADIGSIAAPFPSGGAILDALVKIHPCVNTAQSVAAASLALHAKLIDAPETLTEIELVMADYPVIARQQNDLARTRPQSREAADHSFPFIAAVCLIDGVFGLMQYENERWHDMRVTALMEKIRMRRAAVETIAAANPFPCSIRARTGGGREYTADPPGASPGASKDGLDEPAVIAKFQANTESFLPRAARERIVDAAMEFEHSPTTQKLDAAIAVQGAQS
jgi:2-methylcitrate dehydratase